MAVDPQLYVQLVSSGGQGQYHMIFPYDGIAEADGSSQFDTLQAADDELDSAAYSLYVKKGTFAAGFTVSTNDVYIFVEPGTVIQGAITLSGTDITLVIAGGCDIQATITLSGANCRLECKNGVDIDKVVLSGAKCIFDGGGLGTLVSSADGVVAATVSGADCVIQNVSIQTTTGGAGSDTLSITGARVSVFGVQIVDSDDDAISIDGVDALIQGCTILGADNRGFRIAAARARILSNFVKDITQDAIHVTGTGDNVLIVGNTTLDSGGDPVELSADAENCVVVGNRLDGAVVDASGTSTVASNDETAY